MPHRARRDHATTRAPVWAQPGGGLRASRWFGQLGLAFLEPRLVELQRRLPSGGGAIEASARERAFIAGALREVELMQACLDNLPSPGVPVLPGRAIDPDDAESAPFLGSIRHRLTAYTASLREYRKEVTC